MRYVECGMWNVKSARPNYALKHYEILFVAFRRMDMVSSFQQKYNNGLQ